MLETYRGGAALWVAATLSSSLVVSNKEHIKNNYQISKNRLYLPSNTSSINSENTTTITGEELFGDAELSTNTYEATYTEISTNVYDLTIEKANQATECPTKDLTMASEFYDQSGNKCIVRAIATWAFQGDFARGINCNTLIFPSTLETIGEYAFYGDKISKLDFSQCENLTNLSEASFSSISNLTSVDFCGCNKLTEISKYTFSDCTSLVDVTLNDELNKIGDGVFANCHSLTTITIPNSVNSIGQYAFCMGWGQPQLATIEFTAIDEDTISSLISTGINYQWLEDTTGSGSLPTTITTFLVPLGTKDIYEAAYNKLTNKWSDTVSFSWEEYDPSPTPPAPSDNNINLGIALGVSLGICVGIPGTIGLGFLGKYKSRNK